MSKFVILCVDDEQTILNSLKTELRDTLGNEYLIEVAEGGEEALEVITELIEEGYEIPLMVSDYIMPRMKGDEFLIQAHTLAPSSLKILLTGQADIDAIGHIVNRAKLYRYLSKPWETKDFRLTVTEAVNHYLQEKKLEAQNIALQQMNQVLEQLNREQAAVLVENERLITKLHNNEKRLTQFLDAMPVGVFVINAQGQPYYANYTAQQILGKEFTFSLSSEQAEICSAYITGTTQAYPVNKMPIACALHGEVSSIDNMEIHREGQVIPLEVWGTPIFDEQGQVTYAIAAFRDITERKRAEQERLRFMQKIQESEERFRVIAETIPVPLVITHPGNGVILYANAQTASALGITVDQLVGCTMFKFYQNPIDRKKLMQLIQQQGYVHNYELQFKKVDGSLVWLALFMRTITFNNQTAVLATMHDVTERKLAEEERSRFTEELGQLNNILVSLNKAYERFVPREFLSLLDKQSITDIYLGDQVEKNMTVLFSDIRGFTTLSEKLAPKDNFEFLNVYLGQIEPIIIEYQGFIDKYIGDAIMALFPGSADDAVSSAIAMLKKLARYNQLLKNAGFESLQIGIGLNTGALMLGTLGSQNRMDGTVISDAVNVASRVEGLTKIYGTPLLITEQTCRQLQDPTQYKIRVIDRVQVKGKSKFITVYEIFDADSTESIASKLKTLEDFDLGFQHFHNEQFEAARGFFERVLRVNEQDEVAWIYLNRCKSILSMMLEPSPLILIVDDMRTNVAILSRFLTAHHFRILAAKNGEEALEFIKYQSPHLILLDVMMPGMDGFEVCSHLKQHTQTQDIPIIFMTSLTDAVNKVKGFEAGAVDYITKPFHHQEVLARINAHLNIRHLQQQLRNRNTELEFYNLELKEKIKQSSVLEHF